MTDPVESARRAAAGICAGLPQQIQDVMWGPDSVNDAHTQGALTLAACTLCEWCAMRSMCLAEAIIVHDQYGVRGGLPVKARRELARIARADGVKVDDRSLAAASRLARWIGKHPESVAQAYRIYRGKEGRRKLTARQRRWREKTRRPTPSGPASPPAPTQTLFDD